MQSLGAAFLELLVLEPHEKFIKKEQINLARLIICFNIFNTTNAVAHWIFKMTSNFFCLEFASLRKVHACTCQWLMVDLNSCVCTHLFFSGKSHSCHWNSSKFNFWELLSLWSWWKTELYKVLFQTFDLYPCPVPLLTPPNQSKCMKKWRKQQYLTAMQQSLCSWP